MTRKNVKNKILLIFTIQVIFSCGTNINVEYSGYVYDDQTKSILELVKVEYDYQEVDSNNKWIDKSINIYTDEKGFFSFNVNQGTGMGPREYHFINFSKDSYKDFQLYYYDLESDNNIKVYLNKN